MVRRFLPGTRKCLTIWSLDMVLVKRILCAGFLVSSFSAFGGEDGRFPKGPDSVITPGQVCQHPDAHRYPEGIAYCNRNVSTSLKRAVIEVYDSELGYEVQEVGRVHFKIDHYIPLCMGGSNDKTNIWPQHESVYAQTDPLEGLACEKMADGVLLQAAAIELIVKAKNDLSKAPEILQYLQSL
jgi:hypothetical protein